MRITAFYHFEPLGADRRRQLERDLYALAKETGLRGLCLLGPEGLNMTCSGDPTAIEKLKVFLGAEFGEVAARAQDSEAERHPFRHFKVRRRKEIVTLGRPDLVPAARDHRHLTPDQWTRAMTEPGAVVIDTRNDYETALGQFKGALDLSTKDFGEFPAKVRAANLEKTKPVLIYCTGGIRCEKAMLALEEQGFEDVRQLEGGILNYLKSHPNQAFEGECFVFDYRVAVDQELKPTTRFTLCPHCGQPAARKIECEQCGSAAETCEKCGPTCSKNCAHHRRIGSKSSRPHEGERRKRRSI